jgi:hypothetical protein
LWSLLQSCPGLQNILLVQDLGDNRFAGRLEIIKFSPRAALPEAVPGPDDDESRARIIADERDRLNERFLANHSVFYP